MFPLQIDWDKLINWRFWFSIKTGPFYPTTLRFVLLLFIVLIVLAIVFKILGAKDREILRRKVWRRLWTCFITIGIIGEVINFFIWARAGYLAIRFWYLALLVVFVVWLIFILIYALKKLPREKEAMNKKNDFEKYLPK